MKGKPKLKKIILLPIILLISACNTIKDPPSLVLTSSDKGYTIYTDIYTKLTNSNNISGIVLDLDFSGEYSTSFLGISSLVKMSVKQVQQISYKDLAIYGSYTQTVNSSIPSMPEFGSEELVVSEKSLEYYDKDLSKVIKISVKDEVLDKHSEESITKEDYSQNINEIYDSKELLETAIAFSPNRLLEYQEAGEATNFSYYSNSKKSAVKVNFTMELDTGDEKYYTNIEIFLNEKSGYSTSTDVNLQSSATYKFEIKNPDIDKHIFDSYL
jgi:hypothetical protein